MRVGLGNVNGWEKQIAGWDEWHMVTSIKQFILQAGVQLLS